MRADLDAVAFDIDGTLYPDLSLHARILPFIAGNLKLMLAFGAARSEIRRWQEEHPGEGHEDFFAWQAELFAKRALISPEAARKKLDTLIYSGWRPVFGRVRPYPGVGECFDALKGSGLKLGILSDFLPSQKGDVWGLAPKCDAVLGSEETGALKPSPIPFRALAQALGTEPERVLYVGNSLRSDVRGASLAGMKTACIVPFPIDFLRNRLGLALGAVAREADISFSSYRQLTGIVLK